MINFKIKISLQKKKRQKTMIFVYQTPDSNLINKRLQNNKEILMKQYYKIFQKIFHQNKEYNLVKKTL